MPYQWTQTPEKETLTLWPHQSMTPQGFTWFIGATAGMLSLPLFAVLGSAVAWVLMVCFLITIGAVWRAITSNQHARSGQEVLTVSNDRVDLCHTRPDGDPLVWKAHRDWVKLSIREDGPVEKYLTLRGGGREVELGAFLTPEERETLYDELSEVIAQR